MRSAVIMMSPIKSWPGCSPCIAINSATFRSSAVIGGAGSAGFAATGKCAFTRSTLKRLAGGCVSKNEGGGGGGVGATGSGFSGNEIAPGSCGSAGRTGATASPCSAGGADWGMRIKPCASARRRVVFFEGFSSEDSGIRLVLKLTIDPRVAKDTLSRRVGQAERGGRAKAYRVYAVRETQRSSAPPAASENVSLAMRGSINDESLNMHRLSKRLRGGFHHGFAERRVRVHRRQNLFVGAFLFQG